MPVLKNKRNFWNDFFLIETSSISLSSFRLAVALAVGFHVLPTFCHLEENYFPTAFKEFNYTFFIPQVTDWIQTSPEWLITMAVWIFCISWFFFLIGLLSQLSCIVMTLTGYYFYAINSLHIGTLSWDIVLVTLFLMCLTPYHGDYFSLDCLRRKDPEAYKKQRPFFIQRLLQLQIGFTYFYTALYKVSAQGNWIKGNPIYSLMNYPPQGVMKAFMFKDYLMNKPDLCYAIGIFIVVIEFLMIFLLFFSRTRIAAIYWGFIFHITLILTMDVPAIFFFLFPPQILLFIHPDLLIRWIEEKRLWFASVRRAKLIYDGQCQFCQDSIAKLKVMDLFNVLEYIDLNQLKDVKDCHLQLSREKAMSQLHLVETNGDLHGGFAALRRICFKMPMLYPLLLIVYFPTMGLWGHWFYRIVAKNRYFFHGHRLCRDHACFR